MITTVKIDDVMWINCIIKRIKIIIMHCFNKIVEKADSIITLSNCCIEENGCQQELLSRRGLYYRLYSIQNDMVASAKTPQKLDTVCGLRHLAHTDVLL